MTGLARIRYVGRRARVTRHGACHGTRSCGAACNCLLYISSQLLNLARCMLRSRGVCCMVCAACCAVQVSVRCTLHAARRLLHGCMVAALVVQPTAHLSVPLSQYSETAYASKNLVCEMLYVGRARSVRVATLSRRPSVAQAGTHRAPGGGTSIRVSRSVLRRRTPQDACADLWRQRRNSRWCT